MGNTQKESRDSQNKNLLKFINQENLFGALKALPLLVIIANIIIFSSALKLTGGDYYLASEAIKSIDLNSWWISNLSTIVLAIFFCASPLFYYPSQGISSRAIFYFKETFSITKIPPHTETITAQVLASFLFYPPLHTLITFSDLKVSLFPDSLHHLRISSFLLL